ncbi:aminotransferase class III-fold pyridoxal phosphate-dependent enzyme [Nocardiopsis sp. EMB25]|uniref:aminotransferase family protein n=1 Tax=Nocardiopsis sp. EMB25 TaxID=2835867 RepID=UPI00228344A2|nr:aminotransferase class III-fold pyridoxal phosphate-dependent enzyme [Nocardiopsis sp. EMB25]MCY9782682.1 aminotransferase class III-fold pyridoxal phosphate-dependent enzyme [Nocardiopsis sp. EMB25]
MTEALGTDPSTATAADREALLALDAEHLWHPWSPTRVNPDTVVAVAGQGCEVQDADGRRYLDAKSSGFNATLGYGCREVVDAVGAQLSRLMTYDLGEGSTAPAVRLARRIAELVGPPLTRTFFCNSGSEGVEAAIRIVRFYHAALGRPERSTVVSLRGAYHGSTLGAAACAPAPSPVSDEVGPPGFASVPGPEGDGGPEGVAPLRAHLEAHGDRTAAVLVEPVQARGVRVLPDDYLRAVRELCDRHGVLLVLDEVTTGFGRTGAMFGHQHSGVRPDVLVTGKGLTAGYMSLAAVTTTEHVFGVFDRNKARAGFVHGHTHSGHAAACAAGLAVLDVLEERRLVSNARERGAQLLAELEGARSATSVLDVRGRGLLVAVEMDDPRRASAVRRAMREAGVLARRTGASIVLAPPLIVTAAETERISTALTTAVRS